jgi:ubiquinone/menaquinone biosynthesis C-methylase UbiE
VHEQKDIITAFTEMAPRYEQLMNNELNRFWGINYSEFVSRLLKDFPSSNNDLVLDIATGTSYIPLYLAEKKIPLKKIVGLDLTFEMLARGRQFLHEAGILTIVPQACGSAMLMPFAANTFDIAVCCLATHHMDVSTLLANIFFTLKPGGSVFLADAGGSSAWKNVLIKKLIKTAAFMYFLFQENLARAKAEAGAIGNILSVDDWKKSVIKAGFTSIEIHQMPSAKFWAPDPLIIRAKKQ